MKKDYLILCKTLLLLSKYKALSVFYNLIVNENQLKRRFYYETYEKRGAF